MNPYHPVADQLRERRRGKPGELQLALGLALTTAMPFAAYLSSDAARKLEALKTRGAVAEATVVARSSRSETYVDGQGRRKTRMIYSLSLQHDLNREASYAEWKVAGRLPASDYPALTTTRLDVGQSAYEALAAGQKAMILRDPSEPAGTELLQRVEAETAPGYLTLWYAAAIVGALAGLAMMGFGWRKRSGPV